MSTPLALICPRCHAPLQMTTLDEYICEADGLRFPCIDGIWRFMLTERASSFEKFIREYEIIRRAEGRGSPEVEYYRALPYRDLSGRMSTDWRIRAASFDLFLKKVISPEKGPLRILDLGAGNGWLSNRLSGLGHVVTAVDLMTNDFDGLGCWRFYENHFTPIQAEFNHLPLLDGNADLVIFNASLHYAVNFHETMAEALRILESSGNLVVLDSPVYRQANSGEEMVKEREALFTKQYGFPSNALPSQNFLTYSLLADLCSELRLECQIITPSYGVRWLWRPIRAKLLNEREPAKFHLLILRKLV